MKDLQTIIKEHKKKSPHLSPNAIISQFQKDAIVTVLASTLRHYVNFISDLGAEEYVDEYLDEYGKRVNPVELTVSPAWYGSCNEAFHDLSAHLTCLTYRNIAC